MGKNPPSSDWDMGLIAGQGTQILCTVGQLSPSTTTIEPVSSRAHVS